GAPSAETCDNVDNDSNGQTDEGNPGGGAACATGIPGIRAAGTTACQSGTLVCNQNLQPGTEVCNALDDDCDDTADNVAAGRGLVLIDPLDDDVLDCSEGAVPPTITWNAAQYDHYRVYVSWS